MPRDYNSDRTYAFIKDRDDPLGFMCAKYRYTAADINLVSTKFIRLREVLRNYTNMVTKRDDSIPLVATTVKQPEKKKN